MNDVAPIPLVLSTLLVAIVQGTVPETQCPVACILLYQTALPFYYLRADYVFFS
jgi:hypothetical protein